MRKLQITTSHLIMLVMVSVGVLLLSYLLLPKWLAIVLLVLTFACLFAGLLFYREFHESFVFGKVEPSQDVLPESEHHLAALLEHMPVGVVQFNQEQDEVIWFNPYAALLLTKETGDFDANRVLSFLTHKQQGTVQIGDKRFTVMADDARAMVYFWETTSLVRESSVLTGFSPVIAVVSVDNYDDVTDNLADAEISQINSFVANFISDFANEKKIFYRRTAMDRFYLFTDYLVLSQLISEKFPILTAFREAAKAQELTLTLSFGISYGNHDYQDIGRVAQKNLNLAMVRGGDQVVLRENDPEKDVQYFGGGSTSTIKRSRTRTRAMMSAITDKINLADSVFVVGHKNTDMDALAACVGMQFFASQLINEAYAVYDPSGMTEDVARAVDRLHEDGATKLISLEEAFHRIGRRSLLIMVDHSKLSLTLSREFYGQFSEVIIIDHHRRDKDFPTNAVLSFIESGASSASELVTELIQFQHAKSSINRLQASILMAGIMLDTKNFTTRVTSRTFDVASYLRRYGSDSGEIQSIAAQDFEEYKRINQLILSGQLIGDGMIVATGSEFVTYSAVETSKAADQLLNMSGVVASFAITKTERGRVAISARSKDGVNVQQLMERLGGGGHFNAAAVQLEASSTRQIRDILLTEIQADRN